MSVVVITVDPDTQELVQTIYDHRISLVWIGHEGRSAE